MAKLIPFIAKPPVPIVVQSIFDPCPIPQEVMIAMGISGGLILFGGPAPAKQVGSAEVRPLLKFAT